MKVCDLLNESSINLQSKAENKREAIKALVKLMNKNKNLKKVGEFQKVVIETEEKENADSSSGYVVLYGKTNNVTRLGISIIVTKEEIEFNENKVKTLFLLAVPDNKSDTYLEIIDELNLLLGNNEFREKFDYIKSVDLLLIDDLGAENLTAYNRDEILCPILQYRMDNKLTTFITSNLNIDELNMHLSTSKNGVEVVKAGRIISRIKQLTTDIEMISKNLRN